MKNLTNERNDLDFNLENIELLYLQKALYKDFIKVLKKHEGKNFKEQGVCFNQEMSFYQTTYGKDGKLYSQVLLNFGKKYSLVVNPFEVIILFFDFKTHDFSSEELNDCLVEFMNKNFPNSDYEQKRKEFFGLDLSI